MSNRSEKFLKINMWISKYLIISLPFVVPVVIWALSVPGGGSELHGLKSFLWEIFSWHFMIWFILLVNFVLSLVFWGAFREKILTILTFSKERDERESLISGRASKSTFYSTLSVLILLLFFSGLHIYIYKKPKEEVIDGKRGMIKISYNFEFVNSAKKNIENDESKNENILKLDGIPFTQESLILFLILFHIINYQIFSKKHLRE